MKVSALFHQLCRRGIGRAAIALVAAGTCTTGSLADDIGLFPADRNVTGVIGVVGEAGWENPAGAEGSPMCGGECPCGDSNSAINRDSQNRNWLIASHFRDTVGNPIVLPPGHRVSYIRVNVHGKYPVGSERQRISIEAYLPNGQPIELDNGAGDHGFESPASGNCFWVTQGDELAGFQVVDIAPFRVDAASLTQIFENMVVRVRRIGSNPPPNLRINAIRVRVFTECAPISAPISAMVSRPTVCVNDGGSITLTAQGGEGETLVWYAGGCASGAPIGTGPQISIPSPTESTTYYVRRESACAGATACASVAVSVTPAPDAPSSASSSRTRLCAGDQGTIVLTAQGGSGDVVRWFRGSCGGEEVGCCANPITIPAPQITTDYFVRWERCGIVTGCATVRVTVDPAPGIADQPDDLVVLPGGSASFCTLESAGSRNCTFRWFRNGVALSNGGNISGATSRCLQVNPVGPGDEGAYHAVLTCDCGTATTRFATLSVCDIAATSEDDAVVAIVGRTTELRVTASGEGPFQYTWRYMQQPIVGGQFGGVNSPTLTINNTQLSNLGTYDCLVFNACAPGGVPSTPPIALDVFCPADFNRDRVVNSQDLFDFLAAFFIGDVASNINGDCCINSQDFFDFLERFLEGC